MTLRHRLITGWALALAVAVVIQLAISRPVLAPPVVAEPVAAVVASPSPTPPGAQGPTADRAELRPPHAGGSRAGSAVASLPARLAKTDAAALAAATRRARAAFGLDMLAIGVSAGGRRWSGADGIAWDGVTRITGESPFGIGSITKTFTASLVLQLVEEGQLSLDAEVESLVPGLGVPAGVTVRQLLGHRSGFADFFIPLRDELNTATERLWQPTEVLARAGRWWEPGQAYGYANTNYVVLGAVVERVTGQPFATVLEQRLLRPLGLDETGMLLSPGAPWLIPASWASAFWTSGAMYGSAHDLLGWGDALYAGDVLSDTSRATMLRFGGSRYGLGAERVQVGKLRGYGHSGLIRGYTSLLVHLPAGDITLVVLAADGQTFDPAVLLARGVGGEPSILDLALRVAAPRA